MVPVTLFESARTENSGVPASNWIWNRAGGSVVTPTYAPLTPAMAEGNRTVVRRSVATGHTMTAR